MKENKTLIVAIATVAILVVVFAGGTYAFFTANNNNLSASTVAVTGGAMKITYSDGTNDLGGKLSSTDFQPSDDILVDKTFTLVGKNTATADGGLDMEYYIGIQYESDFTDGQLHWYLKRMDSNSNITSTILGDVTSIPGHSEYTGYNHGTFSPDDIYVKLVTGVFKPSTVEQSVTFNLKMQFPDTGVEQDENKGAIFTGKILINEEPKLLSKYIASLGENEESRIANGLEYDTTDDQNLRYVGATPNNYITFNDETWRIIGVFDVTNAETNETEQVVKIIRNDSIGTYSWDTSESSINSGRGINEWSQADLMSELNGDYLDTSLTSNTTWYSGSNNAKSNTFDITKVIKSKYQQYIMKARWNLGGYKSTSVSAADMYTYERGTTVYQNATDGVTRTTTWDGLVALMYPSDYGFASTDSTCRSSLYDCKYDTSKNWLYSGSIEWLLSPSSSISYYVFLVSSSGVVNGYYVDDAMAVRPSVYLKSNVIITSGDGASADTAYEIK